MNQLIKQITCFLTEEEGTTAVEYAVMLGLIVITAMGAIRTLSDSTTGVWARNTNALQDVNFMTP